MHMILFLCATISTFTQCGDIDLLRKDIQSSVGDTSNLLHRILQDPGAVLQENTECTDAFWDALVAEAKTYQPDDKTKLDLFFKKMLKEYEQKNPIFALRECQNKLCCLTRPTGSLLSTNLPLFRDTFEKEAVENIIDKLEQSKNGIRYISFGSGKLFSDLVLISKVLTKAPHASMTVCLIDPDMEHYIQAREDNNLNAHIQQKESFYLDKVTSIPFKDVPLCSFYYARTRQLLSFLKSNFTKAQLHFYAYKNTESYFSNLPTSEEGWCIQAADCILDDDFKNLCTKSLAYDKNASIIRAYTKIK